MSVSFLPIATAKAVEPEQRFEAPKKHRLQKNACLNQSFRCNYRWFLCLNGLILILPTFLANPAWAADKGDNVTPLNSRLQRGEAGLPSPGQGESWSGVAPNEVGNYFLTMPKPLLDKNIAVPPAIAAPQKFDRTAARHLKPLLSNRFAVSDEREPLKSILPTTEPEPALRLAASPDNLNPGLELPPPEPEPYNPSESPSTIVRPPGLESLEIDFRNDRDNYGQINRIIEPTVLIRLSDGSAIRVRTGYNFFDQAHVEPITNIPLQVGWEGTIDQTTVQFAAGVDFFDRLPIAFSASASASHAILPNVTLSGVADYGPYKFNGRTLENEIRAFRFGPNLYWQIGPDTSLFSLFRVGLYNDGNQEQQSFTRLEHQFGDFYVAANLFTWNYDENVETSSGYFSPPNFLVYNAEAGWHGEITDFLSCQFAVTFGRQRLQQETDSASTYRALCTTRFSPSIEADLDYTYSNVRTATGGGGYNNHSLTGQLRFSF